MAFVFVFSMSVPAMAAQSGTTEYYETYIFTCDYTGCYERDKSSDIVTVVPGDTIFLFDLNQTDQAPAGLKHTGYTCNGEFYPVNSRITVGHEDLYIVAQYELDLSSSQPIEGIVHYITMLFSGLLIRIVYSPN